MADEKTPSAKQPEARADRGGRSPYATGEPLPLILTDASLTISDSELACVTNHLELSPDVTITTLDTFCGSTDYPGHGQVVAGGHALPVV